MKRIIALSITVFASIAVAQLAWAGPEPLPSGKEMKQVAPAPPPECNWTGFYIGLNVGGQFGHSENKDLEDFNFFDKPWGYSESGVVAGGQVGYNYQWKWLVLGIEADGGYMNLDGRGAETGPEGEGSETVGHSDSDFYTTFRGRIGIACHNWLFYGTGGGIGVNYEKRVTDSDPLALNAHSTDFNWGYTVGGGIEYMFGCHWSVKAEYLYFTLDSDTFSGHLLPPFDTTESFAWRAETAGHIVRGGLNYKF
jgi:outer membrane immunogenic protein